MLVAQGTARELERMQDSPTGRCLAAPLKHSRTRRRAVLPDTPSIRIRGADLHNLRKVDARIPLGRLTVVTGVSGSGKSSLARDVLLGNLKRLLAQKPATNGRATNGRAANGRRSETLVEAATRSRAGKR